MALRTNVQWTSHEVNYDDRRTENNNMGALNLEPILPPPLLLSDHSIMAQKWMSRMMAFKNPFLLAK